MDVSRTSSLAPWMLWQDGEEGGTSKEDEERDERGGLFPSPYLDPEGGQQQASTFPHNDDIPHATSTRQVG